MRLVLSLLLWITVPLAAQQPARHVLRGGEVAVYNLAGTLTIEGGSGADVIVDVRVGGEDGGLLRVATGPLGGREALRVLYPDDDLVYPRLGRGSRTELRVEDDGTFGDRGRGRRVRIRGAGDGVAAWADLTVTVPRGKQVAAHLAVGEVTVRNVDGDLVVDVASAGVTAAHTRGSLRIDTGSGDITLEDAEGDVSLDTGSGTVRATAVRGGSLKLDTGSGDVHVADADVPDLGIDTGSGDVTALRLRTRNVKIDTGSGSVELTLLADVDDLSIDTGSGNVSLTVPPTLGAELDIETSSGEIDLGFPIEVRRMERNHLRGRLGDGVGRITVETGSGDVRLLKS